MLDETQSAASEEDYGSAGHMNGAMDPPLPEEAYGGARDDGPAYKEGPPLNGNPVDLDDLKQEYATNGATDNPLTAPIPGADELQQGKEHAGRFTAPVNGAESESETEADAKDGFDQVLSDLYGKIPLTLNDWESRELPPRQPVLGEIFTTATRAICVAETGIGKTHLAFGFAFAMGADKPFCHWQARGVPAF